MSDTGLMTFVVVYDQAARTEEYNVDVTGIFTDGSIPGAWGKFA